MHYRHFLAYGFVAILGCGKGGGGDPPSIPAASEFGTCNHVSDLTSTATWEDVANDASVGCAYPQNVDNLCVSGTVLTAVDNFDETGDGATGNYYVQDFSLDPLPYSGITVFGPTFSPPDLRVFPGDIVDLSGTKEEFVGPSTGPFSACRTLPEFAGTMSFRFDGTTPQQPKVIDIADLHSYATARPWLGMLVRVENVDVFAGTSSGGRFSAHFSPIKDGEFVTDLPSVDNELYDVEGQGPDLSATKHFKAITGIVTYFYTFHLAPRSLADFEE